VTLVWLFLLTTQSDMRSLPVPARFVSEVVRLEIHAAQMLVRGHYDFESTSSNESMIPILYPFVADTSMGEPEVLRMTPSPTVRDSAGIHVEVPIDSMRRGRLEIEYRQGLGARRAAYLLRSTQEWGVPLDRAILEVDWPDSLGSPRFSFPLRAASRAQGRTMYHYEARSFLPDHDLIVTW